MKCNNAINVLFFFAFFHFFDNFQNQNEGEKRKNLEDIYFMCFIFGVPAPLVRKKKGKKGRTPKEKGEISENNCNQRSSFHVLLSSFAYFPGNSQRKKQMKTREALLNAHVSM